MNYSQNTFENFSIQSVVSVTFQHDLCSQRGLGHSDQQTFEMLLPRKLRTEYDRVLKPYLMQNVSVTANIKSLNIIQPHETKKEIKN